MKKEESSPSFWTALAAYVSMARPAFHLVGILPFLLGSFMAATNGPGMKWPIVLMGLVAVVLVMLATYYSGEYYDIEEDTLSGSMEKNRFSGGSQVMVVQAVPAAHAKAGAWIALCGAGIIGITIQYVYRAGPLAIPLGIMGIVAGFFYSSPPLRWVSRGVGELLIGFGYGWLPVATGYYLQTGTIPPAATAAALPIACSIFNVILINEFPDYPADKIAGKRNLVVRMGKDKAGLLYAIVTAIGWLSFVASLRYGLPVSSALFYLPVFLLSLALSILVLRKAYLDRKTLEVICGLTIAVNLCTTLAYAGGLWFAA